MALRRPAGAGTTVTVAAVLLMAIPLTGLVVLHFGTDDGLPDIEFEPEAVVVGAQGRSVTDEQPGRAALEWGEAPSLVAPSWAGTTVEVAVSPGDTVESGDVVVVIDNIDRVAWHSDRPFFRALGRGASGDDVADVQRLLSATGYYEGEIDGHYGGGTVTAAARWAGSIGIVEPDGSFEPGWIVWLPDLAFAVDAVTIAAGGAAPGFGTEILLGAAPLVRAEAVTIDGEPFRRGPGWVADLEGVLIPISAEGRLDRGALDTLIDSTVGDEIAISIMRAQPLEVVVVPATAIMTNDAGDTCIWVQDGADYRATPIDVGAATTRTVNVTGVEPGTPVLMNPGEVLEIPACP